MPASPGPAGQLGELRRGQESWRVAGELRELLDHDGAGRHVDAERQRLGGEHDLHQALDEALLDRLLNGGHHAGVVGGDAPARGPRARGRSRARRGRRRAGRGRAGRRSRGSVPAPSVSVRRTPASPTGGHGVVAAGPAEDEADRREQSLGRRDDRPPRGAGGCGTGGAVETRLPRAAAAGVGVEARARRGWVGRRPAAARGGAARPDGPPPGSRGPARPDGGARRPSRWARGRVLDPLRQLLGVGHRGREADEAHAGRGVDDAPPPTPVPGRRPGGSAPRRGRPTGGPRARRSAA